MKSIFLFVVIMCVGTALAIFIPIISHSGANLGVLMVAGFVFLIMSIVFGVIWRTLSRVGIFGDPGTIQTLMRQGKVRGQGRGRFVVGGVAFGADIEDSEGADGDMFDAGGVDAGDFDHNHIHDHSHFHDHASAHESSHYTDNSSNFDNSSSTTDFSSSTSDFSSSSNNNDW